MRFFSSPAVSVRIEKAAHRPARCGEVGEWLIPPHSKCGIPVRVSGVRIPPSPPVNLSKLRSSVKGAPGPSLRSGFRLRARTPANRLKFESLPLRQYLNTIILAIFPLCQIRGRSEQSRLSWLCFEDPHIIPDRKNSGQAKTRRFEKCSPFALTSLSATGNGQHVEITHEVAL